jgi:hypothetical protein
MATILENYNRTSPSITARLVESSDLAILADWWGFYHKTEYPVDLLSDIGIAVTRNGEPVAAGFLYETNSKMCFSDFCIVNPELPKKERDLAIKTLMYGIVRLAGVRGYKAIFVHARIPKLKARLSDFGFVPLGEVTYFGRALNE